MEKGVMVRWMKAQVEGLMRLQGVAGQASSQLGRRQPCHKGWSNLNEKKMGLVTRAERGR